MTSDAALLTSASVVSKVLRTAFCFVCIKIGDDSTKFHHEERKVLDRFV